MAHTAKHIPESVKSRAEKLKAEINELRYRYHVLDDPQVSDEVYDSLTRELRKLEEQYPALVTPDSPTQRVGGKARSEFAKVRHPGRMMSLNDAFSQEEFRAWFARVKKLLGKRTSLELYCDPKMDGLAVELRYGRDGMLEQASTRGDGDVGEDVTENVRTVRAIPLRLRRMPKTLPLIVRGEVFLPKREFQRINRALQHGGKKAYANPRNLAAGAVRQLDPKVTASRNLSFYAYGIWGRPGDRAYLEQYPTHEREYAALREYGIPTNPEGRVVRSLDGVFSFHRALQKRREKLPYGIDGIVVSLNDKRLYDAAGVAGKAPRGAIAFKFSPAQATTRVKDIRVQVGRTGALTPVAILEPVEVGGVTIQHATLHNADEVKRLDVRVGDTVVIGRAGDVIPQIREVIKGLRPRDTKPFQMPERCPVCGRGVSRDPNGVVLRCTNASCVARHREQLYHFVSRPALDIVGLGPETVDKLVDAGLVRDPADFFTLREEDVEALEGFGDISAKKLLRNIREKRSVPFERLLVALGIRHVGEETALALSETFGSLKRLAEATEEQLRVVPDVGGVVARSVAAWFRDPSNRKLLEKLARAGVKPLTHKRPRRRPTLAGQTVVFTGELATMTREEAKRRAREHGANISESVSRKTSFVVAGDRSGTKRTKAEQLGIRIVDEETFRTMLE